MTEALNSSIGAHPNTRSESNKTYWKSITGAAVTGRTIELSTVAQTPKVTDTFTPLFDQGSFMDRAATFARRLAKPALASGGATAAVAGTAIVVDLDGNYASAQEPSVVPTPEPSVEPSIEPTPTDPLTGLPCVPGTQPTPEPSESIIPDRTLPPDIGMIPGGEALALTGADVFVSSEAQADPSIAVEPAASASPNPETAVNPDCEVDPYSVKGLLAGEYEAIDAAGIKAVINKSSAITFKYYKENGVPDNTKKKEIKYWTDFFKDWTKNPDLDTKGREWAAQVVLMVKNTNKIDEDSPEAKEALMELTRAFYRAGFSMLRGDNGELVDRDTYNSWIEADAQETGIASIDSTLS